MIELKFMRRIWNKIKQNKNDKNKIKFEKMQLYIENGIKLCFNKNVERGINMYTAIDLSKYIVTKCVRDGCPISNLQLQKILYYIQKEFLQNGKIAFADDIEAWQFGPVVPDIYYQFCGYGAMPITREYGDEIIKLNLNDADIIDNIIVAKRALNPWDMVEETHKPGGAWDQTYCNGRGCGNVIPKDLIRSVG